MRERATHLLHFVEEVTCHVCHENASADLGRTRSDFAEGGRDERTEIWNRVTRRPRLAEEEVSEM